MRAAARGALPARTAAGAAAPLLLLQGGRRHLEVDHAGLLLAGLGRLVTARGDELARGFLVLPLGLGADDVDSVGMPVRPVSIRLAFSGWDWVP